MHLNATDILVIFAENIAVKTNAKSLTELCCSSRYNGYLQIKSVVQAAPVPTSDSTLLLRQNICPPLFELGCSSRSRAISK
jgi:hypothetical protein